MKRSDLLGQLARFDDHIAYYTLERIFREHMNASLPNTPTQALRRVSILMRRLLQILDAKL